MLTFKRRLAFAILKKKNSRCGLPSSPPNLAFFVGGPSPIDSDEAISWPQFERSTVIGLVRSRLVNDSFGSVLLQCSRFTSGTVVQFCSNVYHRISPPRDLNCAKETKWMARSTSELHFLFSDGPLGTRFQVGKSSSISRRWRLFTSRQSRSSRRSTPPLLYTSDLFSTAIQRTPRLASRKGQDAHNSKFSCAISARRSLSAFASAFYPGVTG